MPDATILHTADVHLGGSVPAFGAKVAEHKARLQAAFARCIDEALVRRVDAVCIVGDLFDSQRPSERAVQEAVREISRLGEVSPPIPCCIVPGNHDALGAGSVLSREQFRAEHIHLWREPGTRTLAGGALAIHANPQYDRGSVHRPLEGLRPSTTSRFNVALAHGAIDIPDVTTGDPAIITREEIAASGMDYVALGHWHDAADYSSGGVAAHYCGSPEIITLAKRSPGQAYLVTLDETGVSLEAVETGALRSETMDLPAEMYADEAGVAGAIRALADPALILDANLTGLAPEGFTCDLARLQEELEGAFHRLRITDRTAPAVDDISADDVRSRMIVARVTEVLRGRTAQARDAGDERAQRIAAKALQLSLALFQGRDVLR